MLILIDCSYAASRGLLLVIACGLLVLNGESNTRSTLLLSISKHELGTMSYWFLLENWFWSYARHTCTKRLDETKRSETRDETPRPFRQRLRWDPRRTGPRPRGWALCPRRDRDETYYVSRPRHQDRDHIPALPPLGSAGGIVFLSSVTPSDHVCVCVSMCASVHPWCCFCDIYRALMDLRQTFVSSASWDKDEPVRFGVKRSKVRIAAGPYMLIPFSGFVFVISPVCIDGLSPNVCH